MEHGVTGLDEYKFSFQDYREMCGCINASGGVIDYADILKQAPEKYIILRHDVEFFPKRALELAKVEYELGIRSSYFFQVTNNAYNMLSKKNMDLCRQIRDMGHKVGLHFHLNGMTDLDQIRGQIEYEAELLSRYLGQPIDRFSFHRPSALVLESNIKVAGLINAYAPEFFTYYSGNEATVKLHVKYVADSKGRWQYTAPYPYPNEEFFEQYDKVQMLCHPYTWTEMGHDTLSNLRSLVGENQVEFIQTLNSETKYVKDYLADLLAERGGEQRP